MSIEHVVEGYLGIIRELQSDKRELERQLKVAHKTIEILQNTLKSLDEEKRL